MSTIASHPFADAAWIWSGDHRFDLPNRHLQARRAFDLGRVPRSAEIRLTADSRYRLWVNDVPVSRGPARGYQHSWPFDRVDIAPYLRRGRNVVAVRVHSLGIGTFGYVSAGAAGLIVAGRVGAVDLATGGEWRVRFAPEQVRHLRRVSLQLGFQEEVLGDQLDEWRAPGYDDASWSKPSQTHHGAMPWHTVEERGIPLLREAAQAPVAIVSRASRRGGSAADPNPVAALRADGFTWIPAGKALAAKDGWVEVTLPAGGARGATAVVIDVGEEVVASLELAWRGAGAGVVLDAIVAEAVHEGSPVVEDPAQGCRESFGLRLHLDGRPGSYEQFDQWGYRYVVLVARAAATPLRVRVRLRTVGYPLDPVQDLRTSDPMIDQIWDMSVRTQRRCALDAYVDCPFREQAQWWGDARVQAANTFVLNGDARLLARGIRSIARQSVPNGLTYGHAPTIAHSCILPDFTLTWISTLHDHWWQTGDLELIREQVPRVREALPYFRAMRAKRGLQRGLLAYDRRYWLFLDWCPIFKDGYSTLYHFLWIQALGHFAGLLDLVGETGEARAIRKEAAEARAAALRLQIRGVFAGGRDWTGKPVAQDSAHCDALAYLLRLLPERDRTLIDRLKALCARDLDEKDPMRPSPFFMHYVLLALDQAGEREAAFATIRRWWGSMVDRGLTCTEEIWFARPGRASLCHAWSAHPIVHLTRILLGVRQTGVAWRTVDVEPAFLTDRAAGAVATPQGPIRVEWRRTRGTVRGQITVPTGVRARLLLPGIRPRRIPPGRSTFVHEA